jgi:ABC-type lipoprotein release transport system permease subunit
LAALAVLIGVIGGLAIALVGGSRRSASVVNRYFAAGIPYDMVVYSPSLTRAALLAIPGVQRADTTAYVAMTRLDSTGRPIEGVNGRAVDWSSVDPTFHVLAGHVPDGTDPSQVIVNEKFVKLTGLTVEDRIDVQMFGLEQLEDVQRGHYRPNGPRYAFRIAGIVRGPSDIAGDEIRSIGHTSYASTDAMAVSRQFYEQHHNEFLDFNATAYDVELSANAVRDNVVAAITELAAEQGESPDIGPARFQDTRASLQSPVRLETNALLLLAIGLAAIGTMTIAILLRTEQRAHVRDEPTMRALGVTSRQLGAVAFVRTAPTAVGAGAIAAVLAVALSARFPVGIGRQIELEPGIELNGAVVGFGAIIVILIISCLSYYFGRTVRGHGPAARSPSTLAGGLAEAGAPLEVVIGTQFAFDGRRKGHVTSRRAAIGGGAVTLAVVVVIATYLSGVEQLYSVPSSRGWAWDAVVGNVNFPLSDTTAQRLARDPRLEGATVGRLCDAAIGGHMTEVLALDTSGTAPPVLKSGRLPASPHEIALGARLGRKLHAAVGDSIPVALVAGDCDGSTKNADLEMTVVGAALPPVLGEAEVGEGGVVTLDAIAAAGGDAHPTLVLTKFGGDDPAVVVASLRRDFSEEIVTDLIPAEVVNLHRVRVLPAIGLAMSAILGTILLTYALSVGRPRLLHDLAIMRSLGLVPSQLRRVMAWQGLLLAGVVVLVGMPVGVLMGRAVWSHVTEALGVVSGGTTTPWLLLLAPLCAAVAISTTLYTARQARRRRVAELLRSE